MKVGHFGIFFSKGVRLEFFFANRVRKKKNSQILLTDAPITLVNKLKVEKKGHVLY